MSEKQNEGDGTVREVRAGYSPTPSATRTKKSSSITATTAADPIRAYYHFDESPVLLGFLGDAQISHALIDAKDELRRQFPNSEVWLSVQFDPDSGEPDLLVQPYFSGSAEQAMEKYMPLYNLVPHWAPVARRSITFAVEYS